jgi:hypothetical protein
MIEVEPGIYPGLTYNEYDQIRGLNWSVLRRFKKSAAHARAEQLAPPEPSDDMDFGNAFHTLVLEPAKFDERYVIVPEDAPARRSKVDKEWWAVFEEENKGRERVKPVELAELRRMRDGLYANPRAAELLTDPRALREVVVVWDWIDTSVPGGYSVRCKGRIDLVSRWQGVSIVADVKTARDAGTWSFGKDLDTYDYAGQIVWYRDGLQSVRPMQGGERIPYFLVVEKEEPFCGVVYELGQASREAGRAMALRLMARYVEAERSGLWPGYPDGVLELPSYALNRTE